MEGVVSSSSDSSPQISRAASTGSKSGRSLGVLELWEPVRDPWSHSLWEPVRDPGSDEDTTAVIEEAKSRAAPVVDAQGGGGAKAKQPRDLTVLWRNSTFRNSAQRLLEILDEGPSESPKSSLSATDVASSPRHMLRRSVRPGPAPPRAASRPPSCASPLRGSCARADALPRVSYASSILPIDV